MDLAGTDRLHCLLFGLQRWTFSHLVLPVRRSSSACSSLLSSLHRWLMTSRNRDFADIRIYNMSCHERCMIMPRVAVSTLQSTLKCAGTGPLAWFRILYQQYLLGP